MKVILGWDYRGDWTINKKRFPNGLKELGFNPADYKVLESYGTADKDFSANAKIVEL